jgi:hypothetical protein
MGEGEANALPWGSPLGCEGGMWGLHREWAPSRQEERMMGALDVVGHGSDLHATMRARPALLGGSRGDLLAAPCPSQPCSQHLTLLSTPTLPSALFSLVQAHSPRTLPIYMRGLSQ